MSNPIIKFDNNYFNANHIAGWWDEKAQSDGPRVGVFVCNETFILRGSADEFAEAVNYALGASEGQ